MRIEGAHGEPWRGNPPPVPQRALRDPPTAHHAISGHVGGDVLQGDVRRHEDHAERADGEHHRHVYITREMRQQLGEARIAKPRQMQAMLVHGAGDDGIHFAGQRESDGLPHGLACDLAGLFGEQGAGMMGVADHDNLGIERTDGERFF